MTFKFALLKHHCGDTWPKAGKEEHKLVGQVSVFCFLSVAYKCFVFHVKAVTNSKTKLLKYFILKNNFRNIYKKKIKIHFKY